jgi:hypothetical protein
MGRTHPAGASPLIMPHSHANTIHAVTVNHNTSHFVELMLRTLFLPNPPHTFRLHVTVLDNASDDAELPALQSYLRANDISFLQTGFDSTVAAEKHGAAFEAFIREHPDCTHYLFLDSDMWFIERDTIGTMLRELGTAGDNVFANQARIAGYYAGRIIEGANGVPGYADTWTDTMTFESKSYPTTRMTRCSPVCALVPNTPLFRRVVQTVGLTPALRFHPGAADYFDTFSLMTHAMAACGNEFIISSKTVNHFTQAAYMTEHRAPKDRDCLLLLDDLRNGRGMVRENFFESDWVRQPR